MQRLNSPSFVCSLWRHASYYGDVCMVVTSQNWATFNPNYGEFVLFPVKQFYFSKRVVLCYLNWFVQLKLTYTSGKVHYGTEDEVFKACTLHEHALFRIKLNFVRKLIQTPLETWLEYCNIGIQKGKIICFASSSGILMSTATMQKCCVLSMLFCFVFYTIDVDSMVVLMKTIVFILLIINYLLFRKIYFQ